MQYVTGAPKVLVVDGDRAVLEMLQIRLDVAGYHPLIARTGEAGAEIMRNTRPAVAILDINLPDVHGLELLSRLTLRGAKAIHPVLVTGRRIGLEDIQRARALGARDCLAKPYGGADLLERVARLLRPPAPAPAPAPAPKPRRILLVD